jgi:hypothetical protein
LTDLQSDVKGFLDDVSLRLDDLVHFSPKGLPSIFPLLDCLDTLDSLQHHLAAITFGCPKTRAIKASISTHLASTAASLHLAKWQWDIDVSTACITQTPIYGVFYDTGMLFNILSNHG